MIELFVSLILLILIRGQITTSTTLGKLETRHITIDSITSKITLYPAKRRTLCPCNFVLLDIQLNCTLNTINEKCNLYTIEDARVVNALRFESYHSQSFEDKVNHLSRLLWFHPQGLNLARGTHLVTRDQSSSLAVGLEAKLAQMDVQENTEFLAHYAGYITSHKDYSTKDPRDDFCIN